MNSDLYQDLEDLSRPEMHAVIAISKIEDKYLPEPNIAPIATLAQEVNKWAKQSPANGKAVKEALDIVLDRINVKKTEPSNVDVTCSRSPIIIAIEEKKDPIDEKYLLPIERHLTVKLDTGMADELQVLGQKLNEAESIDTILGYGVEIWQMLVKAEDRLSGLFEVVDKSRQEEAQYAQPIAWTGKVDLLCRIYRALLAACRDRNDGVSALLSVSSGSHYFHPLHLFVTPRRMARRKGSKDRNGIEIQKFDLTTEAPDTEVLPKLAELISSEVVIIGARDINRPLLQLAELVSRHDHATTRLALGFGNSDITEEFLTSLLATMPCLSLGDHHLFKDGLLDANFNTFPEKLPNLSVSTVLSTFRNILLQNSFHDNDIKTFKHSLFWSNWSWVGRPLFAKQFGEVISACYPHLMDLRSVAKQEWYVERKEDIPRKYWVKNLIDSGGNGFHLYLTGGGGTGKSCFLRNVFEKLKETKKSVLPVWYKVDAPSSEWDNVSNRIKEETLKALEKRLGKDTANKVANSNKKLSDFLTKLVEDLRSHPGDLQELVIFIDQLERTFESGDNPNQTRLAIISKNIITLLEEVKMGEGIRIFIASRKQYLPDFLTSYEMASENNLHFCVLKEIKHDVERIEFVKTELRWCKENKLVDDSLYFEGKACEKIASETDGHPLKMMLALIRMFSQGLTGLYSETDIDELSPKPWKDLFYVDKLLASKDDLDWYFFLAMAHAKTEIVRFSEVWWRLCLVSPKLTERARKLGRHNFLEHLWLTGHLGRSIHARPLGTDEAGFLEFFHANLRDHLLNSVMNYGGGEQQEGRRGGMPPVWRALDRLTAAARYWNQSQQLMIRDDVKILMVQKDIFVETITINKEVVEAFYLLFMRDAPDYREELFESAKECFVYSALVHDILGRWAFKKLFKDHKKQVDLCDTWLQRADRDSRIKILQYLVELRHVYANDVLCKLVFDDVGSDQGDVWQQLANILSDRLFAVRYRSRFMVAAVDYLLRHHVEFPSDNHQSNRFGEFCTASCNGSRSELVGLIKQMVDEVASLDEKKLIDAISKVLNSQIEKWLKASADSGIDQSVSTREIHDYIPPRIELRISDDLSKSVTDSVVKPWQHRIEKELGLPFPPFTLTCGEVIGTLSEGSIESDEKTSCDNKTIGNEKNEHPSYKLSLLIEGHPIGVGEFYPEFVQTLRRHWDTDNISPPHQSNRCYNDALRECVVWTSQSELNALGWKKASTSFEESIIAWLLELMRRQMEIVFTMQELIPWLDSISNLGDTRLNVSVSYPALLQVFVNLARERVPLRGRLGNLVVELQKVVRRSERIDTVFITQQLRVYSREQLCRVFADETNQVPVMLLPRDIETKLIKLLNVNEEQHFFDLGTEKTLDLAAAISGHFEMVLRTEDVTPVLVCDESLRTALFQLIQPNDPRIHVLSITELSENVPPRLSGGDVISGFSLENDF